jgi:hypothetical protein
MGFATKFRKALGAVMISFRMVTGSVERPDAMPERFSLPPPSCGSL